MVKDKNISDLKKNILDFMRHNNYATAKFKIDADIKSNNVCIELHTIEKKILNNKTKMIVEVENL